MTKNYLAVVLSLLFFNSYSQQLSQVTFSGGSTFSWFSLSTNENVLIRISNDGKILEFGTEESALNNKNYYARKLRPYLGRVEYYSKESDSAFRGKIKSIGSCYFTYYPSTDYPENVGKIKSAGSLLFDYYRKFNDALIVGKIKSIGGTAINYFSSSDNEAFKSKLKLVGNTAITYYSNFDDKALKGKLKSIGSLNYEWYTSFDLQRSGSLKSGFRRSLVNGITYVIE